MSGPRKSVEAPSGAGVGARAEQRVLRKAGI